MSRLIPLLTFTLLAPTTLCAQDVDPFFAGRQAVWLDLLNPTKEEEHSVESRLGLLLPTREEMQALRA